MALDRRNFLLSPVLAVSGELFFGVQFENAPIALLNSYVAYTTLQIHTGRYDDGGVNDLGVAHIPCFKGTFADFFLTQLWNQHGLCYPDGSRVVGDYGIEGGDWFLRGDERREANRTQRNSQEVRFHH